MPAHSTKLSDTTGQTAEQIGAAVDAFRRILRELRVVARKTELATGLTAAQLFVLTAVAESPGCSVNDIAAATMTDRSSVAAVIDRLVETGYLTREPSDDDRRRASIALTASGRRAMRRTSPAPTALLIAALHKVPAKELAGLSAGLTALTRAMGIAHEPAGMLFEEGPGEKRRATKQPSKSVSGRRRRG